MKINWVSYYTQSDGYGRYSSRMVQALLHLGVQVKAATIDHLAMPPWMQGREGLDWSALTISFLPPYYLQPVPGRQWLYSMTEGSRIPQEWVEKINNSDLERVLVPSHHSAWAFMDSGVKVPVIVVPGGVDPTEFPLLQHNRNQPYTFLTLADRGSRKGWEEVWEAFYLAFGGKTSGVQDVRLIIKALPRKEPTLPYLMSKAEGADKRISWQIEDAPSAYQMYSQADCLALPSRSEGWGMPHREAACMGLPVITQEYAGLDDGHTSEWAITLDPGVIKPVPQEAASNLGEWMIADVASLSEKMHQCYSNPQEARTKGIAASRWLRNHQTWRHSAERLARLICL